MIKTTHFPFTKQKNNKTFFASNIIIDTITTTYNIKSNNRNGTNRIKCNKDKEYNYRK